MIGWYLRAVSKKNVLEVDEGQIGVIQSRYYLKISENINFQIFYVTTRLSSVFYS